MDLADAQQGSGVAVVTGGTLTVTVVSGSDFPRDLKAGLYCVIKVKDSKGKGVRRTQKTTAIVRPEAALWNETFSFPVERGWKGFTLKCFIKAEGTISSVKEFIKGHDTPLGKLRISESHFQEAYSVIDAKYPLIPRKKLGSFVKGSGSETTAGLVHIKAAYEPTYDVAGEEPSDSKDAAKLRVALLKHFTVHYDEQILEGFNCSLRESHLRYIPGRFVLTSLNVFFFSHGNDKYKFQFPYLEIQSARKANSAKIIPSAIDIVLRDGRSFHFTNFLHRDSAYSLLESRLSAPPGSLVPGLRTSKSGESAPVRRSIEAVRPRRESMTSANSSMPISEISPRAASPATVLLAESGSGKKLSRQIANETAEEEKNKRTSHLVSGNRALRLSASGSQMVLLPTPTAPPTVTSISSVAPSTAPSAKSDGNELTRRLIEDIYKSEEAERGSPTLSTAELKRSGPFSAKILEDLAREDAAEAEKRSKKEKKSHHHHRRSRSSAADSSASAAALSVSPSSSSTNNSVANPYARASGSGYQFSTSAVAQFGTSPTKASSSSSSSALIDATSQPTKRTSLRRSPRSTAQLLAAAASEAQQQLKEASVEVSPRSSSSQPGSPNGSASNLHSPDLAISGSGKIDDGVIGTELRAMRAREERRRQEERGMMLTRLAATSASPLAVTPSPQQPSSTISSTGDTPPMPNMRLPLPSSPPRLRPPPFLSAELGQDSMFRSSPLLQLGAPLHASPSPSISGNPASSSGTLKLPMIDRSSASQLGSSSPNVVTASSSAATMSRPPAIHRDRALTEMNFKASPASVASPTVEKPKKRDANFTESLFGMQDMTPQKLLRKLALLFVAIFLSSVILPAFQSDTMKDRIEASGVLAVLSLFLQPILWEMTRWLGYLVVGTVRGTYDKHTEVIGQIIFPIVMIPVTNTLLLALVVALVRGFHVSGIWGAFYGSFLMKLIALIVEKLDTDVLVKYWP